MSARNPTRRTFSAASFADQIRPEAGDVFEISAPDFGLPLSNPLAVAQGEAGATKVRVL